MSWEVAKFVTTFYGQLILDSDTEVQTKVCLLQEEQTKVCTPV